MIVSTIIAILIHLFNSFGQWPAICTGEPVVVTWYFLFFTVGFVNKNFVSPLLRDSCLFALPEDSTFFAGSGSPRTLWQLIKYVNTARITIGFICILSKLAINRGNIQGVRISACFEGSERTSATRARDGRQDPRAYTEQVHSQIFFPFSKSLHYNMLHSDPPHHDHPRN